MRPIPRLMLPHAATLAQAAADAYGSETLTVVAELTHIRVEPTETLETDGDGERLQQSATLLYDTRTSRPTGVAFSTGQRVLFEGRAYRVVSVETVVSGQRLHHIQVGLEG